MRYKQLSWLGLVLTSAACTPHRPHSLVEAQPLPPKILTQIVEKPVPQPVYGQLKPFENLSKPTPKPAVGTLLERGNEQARQGPEAHRFFNAITRYDYMPGTLYQIYAAPGKVTTLLLAPGETISGGLITGDSATWKAHIGSIGQGAHQQTAIYLKPLLSGRKTSMVIPTHRRVYHLELTSFEHSYMASVSWLYSEDPLQTVASESSAEPALQPSVSPEQLNFDYRIVKGRGRPDWIPTAVFDDGRKTFIRLPAHIATRQIPAVFVVTAEQKTQLVNYRYLGECLILDRLVDQIELRLGIKQPEVVRIKRGRGQA